MIGFAQCKCCGAGTLLAPDRTGPFRCWRCWWKFRGCCDGRMVVTQAGEDGEG